MRDQQLFSQYAEAILALPPSALTDQQLLPFRLHNSPSLQIYFAPFEWLNEKARVIVVGITPGRASMERALLAARAALLRGCSSEEASQCGKQTGSFSNMRDVLAYRLDELGVPVALGIRSAAELFGPRADLLHPTSCIRYPVFAWDKKKQRWGNYGGYHPRRPAVDPVLRSYLTTHLVGELKRLPNALVIPLGTAVSEALRMSGIEGWRCLDGFPHASNGKGAQERAETFESIKGDLRAKVSAWAAATANSAL